MEDVRQKLTDLISRWEESVRLCRAQPPNHLPSDYSEGRADAVADCVDEILELLGEDQPLPYSLMLFSDEGGWEQQGVYRTVSAAAGGYPSFRGRRAVVSTVLLWVWLDGNPNTKLLDLDDVGGHIG